MKKFILLISLIFLANQTLAMENSLSNREIQAERYLEATPPKMLFTDMADKVAYNLPPEDRQTFKDLLTKHLDVNALTYAIKTAMVNNFTADELSALADFYGSDVGKSAMSKFGNYMAEVMPSIEAEMTKAYAKVSREMDEKKQ
ncbi:MAG: DUF2059 domain-containing protein [Desulfuromonadales bacterium]|nr:DUF2059 domain-containing protein [Desulfuromonadales bacterium]MBN2791473.1 DUF2059 domain-containing protein [Desulfuromonadales bacterium]